MREFFSDSINKLRGLQTFLHVQWKRHGEVEKNLNLLQNSNSLGLLLTNLNRYKWCHTQIIMLSNQPTIMRLKKKFINSMKCFLIWFYAQLEVPFPNMGAKKNPTDNLFLGFWGLMKKLLFLTLKNPQSTRYKCHESFFFQI